MTQYGWVGLVLGALGFAIVKLYTAQVKINAEIRAELTDLRKQTDEYMVKDRSEMTKVINDNTRALENNSRIIEKFLSQPR